MDKIENHLVVIYNTGKLVPHITLTNNKGDDTYLLSIIACSNYC